MKAILFLMLFSFEAYSHSCKNLNFEASKILELEEGASASEIRKAYNRLALQVHPDKCRLENKEECHTQFLKINAAKDGLIDAKFDDLSKIMDCSISQNFEEETPFYERGSGSYKRGYQDHCRDPFCSKCTFDGEDCFECEEGFSLKHGHCFPSCDFEHCERCEFKNPGDCASCEWGYGLDSSKKCKKCPQGCALCDEETYDWGEYSRPCRQCDNDYYFSADFSKCIPRPNPSFSSKDCNIEHCKVCYSETSCFLCESGYEEADHVQSRGFKWARKCLSKEEKNKSEFLSTIEEKVLQILQKASNRPKFIKIVNGDVEFDASHFENLDWDLKQSEKMNEALDRFYQSQIQILAGNLSSKIADLRKDKEAVLYFKKHPSANRDLIARLGYLLDLRASVRAAIEYKSGTCGHFAAVSAALALKLDPQAKVEIVHVQNPGSFDKHTFVVVNRTEESSLHLPKTWGKAVLIDLWSKQSDEPGIYNLPLVPSILEKKSWKLWQVNRLDPNYPSDYPEALKEIQTSYLNEFLLDLDKF